ncbi:MAG: hypothetical protein IKT38_07555 [Clostridia bacterium]|nr:hypothetical protein [Clostridia bacterium]
MIHNEISVVCIKPNEIPRPDYIENDLLYLNKLVNIDKNGNPWEEFESFKIVEIKDNINIISSPKGKERSLPLVRKVGRYSKFYGVMYIVKLDSSLNLVSMTHDEVVEYCVKFFPDEISMKELGLEVEFPDDCDDDDDYEDELRKKDDGNRRIEIWTDDW